eukprot:scaffold226232_cov27-Tisochrysis_lutea.AAC.1
MYAACAVQLCGTHAVGATQLCEARTVGAPQLCETSRPSALLRQAIPVAARCSHLHSAANCTAQPPPQRSHLQSAADCTVQHSISQPSQQQGATWPYVH